MYFLGHTNILFKQERISVGCVSPNCTSCVCFNRHQISAPVGRGPEVNTVEQVWVMATMSHLHLVGAGGGGPCTARFDAQ